MEIEEAGPPPTPLWIVTFTDLMSLLLTFFILLLTFSSPRVEKLFDLRGSIKGTFGIFDDAKDDRDSFVEASHILIGRDQFNPFSPASVPRFRPIEDHEPNRVIMRLKNQDNLEELLVDRIEEGYRIRIGGVVQFLPGEKVMSAESFNKLAKVARAVEFMPYHLVVVGHTGGGEEELVKERGMRPMDLATERAVMVADRLHRRYGIDKRVLCVSAYGPQVGDTGIGFVEFILAENKYFAERW